MSQADELPINYDEGKIGAYTLPELLRSDDGTQVTDAKTWERLRRPELLRIFEDHVYGRTPEERVDAEVVKLEDAEMTELRGLRRQARIRLSRGGNRLEFDLLLYLPLCEAPAPVFLGMNFKGNQTVRPDPAIWLCRSWLMNDEENGIVSNRATAASRGVRAYRWPVERILERGYGIATLCYCDLDPDFDDGFRNGAHGLFDTVAPDGHRIHTWGTIAVWAWGLRQALDYLLTVPGVDGSRVAVIGHSRLGKAALWAGAQDQRFALAISNDSGCGGAALSRRNFGETIAAINRNFPHWFHPRFREYAGREAELPVDQHSLLSLIAPRPLYVASAAEDLWADPRGEFLSAFHAGAAYRLYGLAGLPTPEPPEIGGHVHGGGVGYHIRSGGHDIVAQDWEMFLDFADRHLRRR